MSIRQRGKTFEIRITKKGKQFKRTAPSRVTAEVVEVLMSHAFERGLDPLSFATPNIDDNINFSMAAVDEIPADYTVDEALRDLFEQRYRGGKSTVSVSVNSREISNYFGGCSDVNLAFTQEAVDGFVKALFNKGNSRATVNRKSSLLRVLIDHCGKKITNKPEVKNHREDAHRIRVITRKEENEILSLMKDEKLMRRYIVLSLETGLRQGEVLSLTVGDIDFKNKTLHLDETKNGKSRTVPLTERALEAIKEIEQCPTKQLVLGELTEASLRRLWTIVKAKMNLEKDKELVPHAMRHTCATRMTQKGVPTDHIKLWLGHTDIKTTLRYAHANVSDLMKVRDTMSYS